MDADPLLSAPFLRRGGSSGEPRAHGYQPGAAPAASGSTASDSQTYSGDGSAEVSDPDGGSARPGNRYSSSRGEPEVSSRASVPVLVPGATLGADRSRSPLGRGRDAGGDRSARSYFVDISWKARPSVLSLTQGHQQKQPSRLGCHTAC